jgi:hypothetical protein
LQVAAGAKLEHEENVGLVFFNAKELDNVAVLKERKKGRERFKGL